MEIQGLPVFAWRSLAKRRPVEGCLKLTNLDWTWDWRLENPGKPGAGTKHKYHNPAKEANTNIGSGLDQSGLIRIHEHLGPFLHNHKIAFLFHSDRSDFFVVVRSFFFCLKKCFLNSLSDSLACTACISDRLEGDNCGTKGAIEGERVDLPNALATTLAKNRKS